MRKIIFLFLTFIVALSFTYAQQYTKGPVSDDDWKPITLNPAGSSAIFLDDMNGDNTVAGLEARGWVVLNEDGGGLTAPFYQGVASVFAAYEGPDTGYVAANYNGGNAQGVIDQWLISQEITVASGDTLSFWHRSPDGSIWPDSIYVRYSTTAGITPGDFDQTWGRYEFPLSWTRWTGTFSHTGTIRFAIQYYIADNATNSNYIGLDYIEVISASGSGGTFPEVLYYSFNEAGSDSTKNDAVPGSGFDWAQVMGALTLGDAGQCGSAIVGAGGSSGTDYINTGWATDIGTSDWTISVWLNNLTADFNYLFGDNTAGSWRSFMNGAAGDSGVILRGGGMADHVIAGVVPGPSVVTWVYDAVAGETRAYLNGVFVDAVVQAPLDITGPGPFKVGGYSTSAGLWAGSLMDEFRLYNRALDDVEIANTWSLCPVPVELTFFTATVNDNDVTLNWETASEINNSGFQVERKSTGDYESIGFVPGYGTTTETRAYSFSDANILPGTYSYRLKQIDFDGTFEYSDPVEVDIIVPDVYSLHQNYPNPFNPSTTITFTLAANANVTLRVFDVLGQEVMTLINQDLTAGIHTYDFDAAGFNSGVYFYRIEANGIDGTNFTNVKKMILLK